MKFAPEDEDEQTDALFKALAERSRREILDLLKERPALTVGQIAERFVLSRFAIMKHLKALEATHLVVSKKDGRMRRLFLNPVPIQQLYDRWMSRYQAPWARTLSTLKRGLEEESRMSKLEHLYVTFIKTTPEALWDALTNPERSREYFYGTAVESDFKAGSPVRWVFVEGELAGKTAIEGEILEVTPHKKLVQSFRFPTPPHESDPPSKVTWEIEPQGAVCKLTVTHEFDAETETFKTTRTGWAPVFSGLKTLLETGAPLGL